MKPTPRMVRISLRAKGPSTLRRRRAILTSITLSSGVERSLTFQMSWPASRGRPRVPGAAADISAARTPVVGSGAVRPGAPGGWRVQLEVGQDTCPIISGLPRRSSSRMRAKSSGKAKGLTRWSSAPLSTPVPGLQPCRDGQHQTTGRAYPCRDGGRIIQPVRPGNIRSRSRRLKKSVFRQ